MVPTPHTDRLWTLHPGSLSRPTYLAPPTPQGPFSLQEAAGATRSHEAGPGARQAVVWESEGGLTHQLELGGSTVPLPQVQLTCSSSSQNWFMIKDVTQDQPGEEMQRAKSGERARGFHDG